MLQDEITQILCMSIICLSDLPLLCGYYVGIEIHHLFKLKPFLKQNSIYE